MKEFIVTFFLSNGQEIRHMMEGLSLEEVKEKISREFIANNSPLLDVDDADMFQTLGNRENLDRETLQRRLILCLYGLGTNTGLKRIAAGDHGESYKDFYCMFDVSLSIKRTYGMQDQR